MMNVLINPKTGNITGIVDWAESRILPFGFPLYGLDNVLGWMDSEGWHYYDGHRELDNLFWKIFQGEAKNVSNADMHLIRVAKMAGIFCQYGFVLDTKGVVQSVRTERDGGLAYLNTFGITSEWTPILPTYDAL
jgi:hypothetical protein